MPQPKSRQQIRNDQGGCGLAPPRVKTLLDTLDDWTERFDAHVMISRRLDLSRPAPNEWSAILTRSNGEAAPGSPITEQFQGHGMTQARAIEGALCEAGVNPCATCGWAETCEEGCHS